MKKVLVLSFSFSLIISLCLCSCGDTTNIDNIVEKQKESQIVSIEDTQKEDAKAEINAENTAPETTSEDVSDIPETSGEYDVDLTVLDSTMVYAQVYDMLNNPDEYNGKIIHAEGPFSYFKDEQTGKEYFAVLIQDATACCAQGIEFVLKESHVYPYDYPDIGTNIAITGICDIYKEGNGVFCQLLDAEYEEKK